jgi:hypothetical protein
MSAIKTPAVGCIVSLPHVAFLLHGAAGRNWEALKRQGKILQHTRHENERQ